MGIRRKARQKMPITELKVKRLPMTESMVIGKFDGTIKVYIPHIQRYGLIVGQATQPAPLIGANLTVLLDRTYEGHLAVSFPQIMLELVVDYKRFKNGTKN